MRELNKQVDYRGYKINISVKPTTTSDFEIVVNDLGHTNYYKKYQVKKDELETELVWIEGLTKEHFDSVEDKSKSETEKLLNKLGYK